VSIGKMKKHNEMLRQRIFRPYLPETHWLTPARTLRMLKSYSSIFIKPNHGSGGTGIIRAKRKRNGFEVRCGRKRKYAGSQSLYKAISSFRKQSKRYLVQRGLQLATYKGTIFDIRVYMQKPKSKWIVSGKVARVAAPHRFVTNYQKGGHAESLRKVLSKLFKNNRSKVKSRIYQIERLSYRVAETLSKQHAIRELGIDIALEKNGRLWIIEANSKPGHMLFTQLRDKTKIRRIMRYKRVIKQWKT
jgi:glutathione synthase/RimK-type ligase-like ATP-grasp enzyme